MSKQRILELVKDKPKHYSKMIKCDAELSSWVSENSIIQSSNYAEMTYSAVYDKSNICKNGNKMKFSGFSEGWKSCGVPAKCACIREQISKSVTDTKKSITEDQQAEINSKRKKTNLEKYGVECSAQSESIKKKHRDFYSDSANKQKANDKRDQTMVSRYGSTSIFLVPEIKNKREKTLFERYNVTNVAQIPSTKAKLRARTAEYKINGHLIRKGYERFKEYIDERFNFTLLTPVDEYEGVKQKDAQEFEFKCNKCQTVILKRFYHSRGMNCDICNPKLPSFSSKEEQEVFDYITTELNVLNGKQGDKSIINPYELDMIFPDQMIAIEYCGLYWHSELSSGKDSKYHHKKMLLANEKGYRLITIFSDEWNLKKDLIKSKLANIFKKTTTKHFARKLQVRLVDSKQSQDFQKLHHLQGASSAKINLGLFTESNVLVALMTFSNGRKALNTKSVPTEYELVRFVTDGSSVVGGASKLLSYFIKNYNPTKIISYADLRWSEGNVYEKLNFKKISGPTIGYWYVDEYQYRLHRYNFTKGQLVKEGADPNKTEWQNMQDLGYDRIWDCGHQKFVMEVSA